MNSSERQMILDYLGLEDKAELSLADLIESLIENANESAVEYGIVACAYENGVPVEKFDDYRDEVMSSFSDLGEGQEISPAHLEAIALKFTT